jgi:hypothetical protein
LIGPRAVDLGEMTVRRALPSTKRKMVGPFIFFDQMGPAEFLRFGCGTEHHLDEAFTQQVTKKLQCKNKEETYASCFKIVDELALSLQRWSAISAVRSQSQDIILRPIATNGHPTTKTSV